MAGECLAQIGSMKTAVRNEHSTSTGRSLRSGRADGVHWGKPTIRFWAACEAFDAPVKMAFLAALQDPQPAVEVSRGGGDEGTVALHLCGSSLIWFLVHMRLEALPRV